MRNVNDADAIFTQIANDLQQFVNFSIAERRRRLVHDQNPRVGAERPGDFDQLLLGWTHYQQYDKIGPNFDVWIDEVAVDGERIGCSR